MRVISPPRIEANESGIRVNAGLRLAFFAACISTGMSMARAATLFMMADRAADTADMMPMWAERLRPDCTTTRAISSTAPDLESALLRIRTRAIMIVAW